MEKTSTSKLATKNAMGIFLSIVLALGGMTMIFATEALAPSGQICQAQAKTVKVKSSGWYKGELTGSKKDRHHYGEIYRAELKGSQLIVWGTLRLGKKQDSAHTKFLKSAKRIFRVTAKTRYQYSGGDVRAKKYSKKKFAKYVKQMGGLGLSLHVKNGKVVKAILSS